MTSPAPGVERIFDLATAFWRSSVLFTACELGVFDALVQCPATAAETAARLGASRRGVHALLESCAAVGLLRKEGDRFANTAAAECCLTASGAQSLLDTLRMQVGTVPLWQRLTASVRSGEPAMPPADMLGGDPAATRRFVMAMHERARGVARALVEAINLAGVGRLADIGGGPGTYAVLLAEKHPELRVTVLDLPPVLEVARELLEGSEVRDRIELRACDATRDELGGPFDAALVSGLLHRLDEDKCRKLFGRIHSALSGNGIVILNDLFADGTRPEMAVLFGLQMLLTTREGRTHQLADVKRWLAETGFDNVRTRTLPPPLPHSLVTAGR